MIIYYGNGFTEKQETFTGVKHINFYTQDNIAVIHFESKSLPAIDLKISSIISINSEA